MNAEDIFAKICAISGKQISSGSWKTEIEPPPGESFSSITAARTSFMVRKSEARLMQFHQGFLDWEAYQKEENMLK